MSSFRKPLTIYRRGAASLSNGDWSESNPVTAIVIKGSVQPASGLKMNSLPDGRRLEGAYAVFTSTEVMTARKNGSDYYNPDIIIINGLQYEAIHIEPWQSDVINHYLVIFQKTESPVAVIP